MDLLFGENDIADMAKESSADLLEARTHVEAILREVSANNYNSIREIWDNYLYPKRLFTTLEKTEKNRIQMEMLTKFTIHP